MKREPAKLSETVYDVLVIGGGIYGVCVAWDAALRGLSVALVEKGDFGHATSFNSLRIIHGGFRYLQHANIRRMRRSMYERSAFMRIAPHLVHPLPFLIPTYGHFLRGQEIFHLALLANDLLSFDRTQLQDPQKHLPRGRMISRAECLRILPGLEAKDLTGAAIIYDSQMSSSERMIISFARSATEAGAEMANYVEVTGFLRSRGRLVGVQARDLLNGDDRDIRAKILVNTSGPWLDRVAGLLANHPSKPSQVLSKAFNVVVNRQWTSEYAFGVYSKGRFKDKDAILNKGTRLFFITPWHNRSLIGTAHLPYDTNPDDLKISEAEVQEFLDEINKAYPAAGLTREDVTFVYGGLVPMTEIDNGSDDVQLMKQYRIHDHKSDDRVDGLISVSGVKFTEARHVAEKAVALVFQKLGKTAPKSRTAFTPIHGGQIERFNTYLSEQVQRNGLPTDSIRRLVYHYGSGYAGILKYLDNHSDTADAAIDASRIMTAEVLHAVREEMAQKLADVVLRRTGIGVAGDPGLDKLKICAAVMANELGWNCARLQEEIAEVTALI